MKPLETDILIKIFKAKCWGKPFSSNIDGSTISLDLCPNISIKSDNWDKLEINSVDNIRIFLYRLFNNAVTL